MYQKYMFYLCGRLKHSNTRITYVAERYTCMIDYVSEMLVLKYVTERNTRVIYLMERNTNMNYVTL